MADDIEDEQSGEEQKEEEALPERLKKIFINHVDSFHGKHIARVSSMSREAAYWMTHLRLEDIRSIEARFD